MGHRGRVLLCRRDFALRGKLMAVSEENSRRSADDVAVAFAAASYATASGAVLVADINLQVRTGETLVLLGRSGSGKSTTLRLINRMLDPTTGEVRVLG